VRGIVWRLMVTWPVRPLMHGIAAVGGILGRIASLANTARLFPGSQDCYCHWTVEVKYPGRITLGRGVIIGQRCTVGAAAPVVLGDHVHLSKGVYVETAGLDFSAPLPYPHVSKPIIIGEGVWIGAEAMILGGVTIGAGCIIGAGAVISKDVPPRTIVTGQPTRSRLMADAAAV
jgi:acetyltransferase-like isoleucine patch superfamily enzyme